MASMEPAVTQAAHDDLDDLFNYSIGDNDPLQAPEQDMEAEAPLDTRRPKPVDLGIDEEVKQKARRPNPKLDEDRYLLSYSTHDEVLTLLGYYHKLVSLS